MRKSQSLHQFLIDKPFKKAVLLVSSFVLLQFQTIHSQDSVKIADNLYYTSLKDKLTLYVYGISKLNQFQLENAEKGDLLQYKPNENFNLGLGFNYRWAGIGAAFNFGFINNDDHIYGETQSFDVQLDLYTKRMLFSANLQHYRGYFWKNVDDYYPDWDVRDSVIIRPDIRTFSLGTSGIYSFNSDRFSFRAAFANTEWQKKSAGSWITGGYFSIYGVEADSSLVPTILHSSYPSYDSLTKLTSFDIGGTFGYSYSLVIKEKIYINGTLLIGLALHASEALNQFGNDLGSVVRPTTKTHIRLALGYNNEKCYYGISFVMDSFLVQNKGQSEFTHNYGKFRIFYGRRFSIENAL